MNTESHLRNRELSVISMPGGFYLNPHTFRHRGKRYSLRSAGTETLLMLGEIACDPQLRTRRGLLVLRPRIRRALSLSTPVALSYTLDRLCALDKPEETVVIRLVLWMLGRIGNPYAVNSVVAATSHPDFRVRREALRTLSRLEAWSQLRRIVREHPDPRTRKLAEPPAPRVYKERLAAFVASTEPRTPPRRQRPLVVTAEAEIGFGRPPKSIRQIRRVLQRIHRLVRRSSRRPSLLRRRRLALFGHRNSSLGR